VSFENTLTQDLSKTRFLFKNREYLRLFSRISRVF
jgi:hypothetical protein